MADNRYTETYDQQQIIQLDKFFTEQKNADLQDPFPSAIKRIADIKRLKKSIISHEHDIICAMKEDFGNRSEYDTKFGDILTTVLSANYTIKHIKRWMKSSKRHVNILFQPAKAKVHYQPLGVIGIITPWNYPMFLALGPLISALSAGNRAIIKMSEFTPATNKVMKKLLSGIFSSKQVALINGGVSVSSHFSSLAFDHIIFTGSTTTGKKVMSAAAHNLTPVTLELGGKSPVIIDEKISIDTAVERFILAKTLNSGQTCVAPDYILCPKEKMNELICCLKNRFNEMYPNINSNDDYSSIINNAQFNRLLSLLDDAKDKGANVHSLQEELGQNSYPAQQRKIPLTIVTNTNKNMTIMQEEIFGPLLPIIGYNSMEQAIAYINERPKPLALYLMSFNIELQQHVIKNTKAGGVCINEAALHVAQDDLPFGGIGDSGMGHYHGHEGFLTLSKAKPVFSRGKFSLGSMIFPPYNKTVHRLIYKFFVR